MPKIEYVAISKTVGSQNLGDFPADDFRAGQQHSRIEVPLKRHAVTEYSDGAPDAQETNMIRTFSALMLSGEVDPTWPDSALKTQLVLDACRASARSDGALVEVNG